MNCDDAILKAMAAIDEARMLPGEVEQHVAGCERCRREIEELRAVAATLSAVRYESVRQDVWPTVRQEIGSTSRLSGRLFAALVASLAVVRLAALLPETNPGAWINLVPVVLAVAVFARLGVNPFAIQSTTDLTRGTRS